MRPTRAQGPPNHSNLCNNSRQLTETMKHGSLGRWRRLSLAPPRDPRDPGEAPLPPSPQRAWPLVLPGGQPSPAAAN